MDNAIWMGLFLPLVGFMINMMFSFRIGRLWTGLIASGVVLASFLCFSWIVIQFSQPLSLTLFKWISLPYLSANFTLYIDTLSLLMTLIITGVGFLIHVYANGYMDHDEDYARFFACLNFFVFSMLLLVLAKDLLLLFVGWEGVGLASYLLIGFWYRRSSAAKAATKAFVVNRVGDLGLLLGLLLTFQLFGTSDMIEIGGRASKEFALGAPIITLLTMLYFIGATGKSAQLPLHTWLPDAMEGPTPVSALIHAATMVTAGVYLIVRLHEVFLLAPLTLMVVGAIGALTSLYASLSALGQTDLKRVLAYSTVSQLGLMFMACGVGAFYPAMFHLTTHAFIKALLFLSAGNVVHMLHGTTEMAQMGGLARIFKKSHLLFLIGVLALSGIPPFAAFFSKDLILEQEHLAGYFALYLVAVVASLLTGFYLMRAYWLAFMGKPHFHESSVSEAPRIMTYPVAILAILSILGGFLGFAINHESVLEIFLDKSNVDTVIQLPDGFHFTIDVWVGILIAVLGVGSAVFVYSRYAERLGPPFAILKKAFYIDAIYAIFFVQPLKACSKFIANVVEPSFFDGMVRGAGKRVQQTASTLQLVQSGQIRSYVAWMIFGFAFVIVYFVRS